MGKEYEVVCPHCKKRFTGELIEGDPANRGFKCPHCRLFSPLDRVEVEPEPPEANAAAAG